jgi:hypothetical protein
VVLHEQGDQRRADEDADVPGAGEPIRESTLGGGRAVDHERYQDRVEHRVAGAEQHGAQHQGQRRRGQRERRVAVRQRADRGHQDRPSADAIRRATEHEAAGDRASRRQRKEPRRVAEPGFRGVHGQEREDGGVAHGHDDAHRRSA